MKPRFLEKYEQLIVPTVKEKFGFKNSLWVPRLKKIVVNMGVGEAVTDIKILEKTMEELATITGQKPIMRRAKKAIANFKIRAGLPIGCMVTLRKNMMYEFLDRLINVALPRIRDFNGVARDSFDESGNYSLGLKEQTIFPEIEYDKIQRAQGMNVTLVFNGKNKEETFEVLRLFGMPFK
ncbi:MAG: 50S ribosomal protein L5 [Candidatus Omnitrophota bacterium]|nr:50S ribosomal protein L5 [Candidatus Omnitrophota bacterium]